MRGKMIWAAAMLAVLLLTACSRARYEEDIAAENAGLPTDTTADIGESTEELQTELKEEETTEEALHILDYDEEYFDIDTTVSQSAMLESNIAVSDKGIYIINNVWSSSKVRLNYYDFETMTVRPWCSRVDCSHETEECDAVFGAFDYSTDFVFYNECYVYLMARNDTGTWLVRYDEDGGNETTIGRLWEENNMVFIDEAHEFETPTGRAQPYIVLHRGRAYYVMNTMYKKYELYSMELEPGSEAEYLCTIDTREDDSGTLAFVEMQIAEDVLYLTMDRHYDMYDFSPESHMTSAYSYDIRSGEFALVSDELAYGSDIAVRGNDLYYNGKEGIMCYSWESKISELAAADSDYNNNGDYNVYINCVGNYLIMDNLKGASLQTVENPCVKVYDLETGEEVGEIPLLRLEGPEELFKGCDGRFLYVLRVGTQENFARVGLEGYKGSHSGNFISIVDLRTLGEEEREEYFVIDNTQ